MKHTIHNDCNEDDDVLSLRDLQMYDQTTTSSTRSSPRTPSGQEPFEFFPTTPSDPTTIGDITFFGKVIRPTSVDHKEDDRGLHGSSSFRLSERATENVIPMRSVSHRDLGSPRHGVKLSTSVKKVRISKSASTSTSKSKGMMSMFGPVKFMPEMEMRSMRERQLRRAPSAMFPVTEGGGDDRKPVTGRDKTTVTCRTRLNSVFERSISCLRI